MNDLIALHAAYLRASGMSRNTITAAVETLERLDRYLHLGIAHTTRAEIEKWLGNEHWKPATRGVYHHHAAKFYAWATDDDVDLIDINPMLRVKPPRVRKGEPRPLSDGQIETLLSRAAMPYRLFALIALETGLRCCEMAELHKEDIGDRDVYVRRAKGGASATVPGRPELLIEAVRDLPHGLLAESAGGVADAQWISRRSAAHFHRSLHLPDVTLHRCRHTYARRLRDAGGDAFLIKRSLRHSSLASTQIYVGASEDECRQAVRGLPPLPYKNPVAC